MIIIILVIAILLRLVSLDQSLWLDEAINVTFASKLSIVDFLTKYTIADFHPPGYFFVLWLWIKFFGDSEIAVRLPSVLFGVATVYFTYLIGQNLFNKKIGLLAAALLTATPLHIYYSQEARMYSMAAFAVTLSFYFLIQLLNNKKLAQNLISYALSVSLILYSDYVAYLILPGQLIIIFWRKRQLLKLIILAQLLAIVTLLPWLLIFPAQLANGRVTAQIVPGWREVVGGTAVKDVLLIWIKILIGRISFDSKLIYATVVGGVSLLYAVVISPLINKKEKNLWLIFGWFGLPIILAFIGSFFIPILSYFRLLFIVPAFVILLAAGLGKFTKKWKFLAICLILLLNFVFSLIYLLNSQFQREDWRATVKFLDSVASEQSVVLVENNDLPAPFNYYYKHQIDARAALVHFPANSENDVINLAELLQNKSNVYLVNYLVDISDPQRLVVKRLQAIGFHQTQTFNFNGVGFVYLYRR